VDLKEARRRAEKTEQPSWQNFYSKSFRDDHGQGPLRGRDESATLEEL
jgi:hypothetical protein